MSHDFSKPNKILRNRRIERPIVVVVTHNKNLGRGPYKLILDEPLTEPEAQELVKDIRTFIEMRVPRIKKQGACQARGTSTPSRGEKL